MKNISRSLSAARKRIFALIASVIMLISAFALADESAVSPITVEDGIVTTGMYMLTVPEGWEATKANVDVCILENDICLGNFTYIPYEYFDVSLELFTGSDGFIAWHDIIDVYLDSQFGMDDEVTDSTRLYIDISDKACGAIFTGTMASEGTVYRHSGFVIANEEGYCFSLFIFTDMDTPPETLVEIPSAIIENLTMYGEPIEWTYSDEKLTAFSDSEGLSQYVTLGDVTSEVPAGWEYLGTLYGNMFMYEYNGISIDLFYLDTGMPASMTADLADEEIIDTMIETFEGSDYGITDGEFLTFYYEDTPYVVYHGTSVYGGYDAYCLMLIGADTAMAAVYAPERTEETDAVLHQAVSLFFE